MPITGNVNLANHDFVCTEHGDDKINFDYAVAS